MGAEAMVHIEVIVPSARLAFSSELSHSHGCIYVLEALEEKRYNTEDKWLSYQKQISKVYNKRVRPKTLNVGDLILKATRHVKKA